MPGDIDIASVAELLADPTRVSILMTLSDGRALPAGELARSARVAPSTASMHLTRLVEGGLISVQKQGRHRYFQLANPAIVHAFEVLAPLAPALPVRSLRESDTGRAVRAARMCYNHLAGNLGVRLSQALVERQILAEADEGYTLTGAGRQWLHDFGIEDAALKQRGTLVVPHHIDWSERRHHVAGTLGAALARRLLELEWIKRAPSSRAIHITERGRQALLQEFELCL